MAKKTIAQLEVELTELKKLFNRTSAERGNLFIIAGKSVSVVISAIICGLVILVVASRQNTATWFPWAILGLAGIYAFGYLAGIALIMGRHYRTKLKLSEKHLELEAAVGTQRPKNSN